MIVSMGICVSLGLAIAATLVAPSLRNPWLYAHFGLASVGWLTQAVVADASWWAYPSVAAGILQFARPLRIPLTSERRSEVERAFTLGARRSEAIGRARFPLHPHDLRELPWTLALCLLQPLLGLAVWNRDSHEMIAFLALDAAAGIGWLRWRASYAGRIGPASVTDASTVPWKPTFDIAIERKAAPPVVFDQRPPAGQEGGFASLSLV